MASRLQDTVQRGLAADRPAASAVAPGTLYYSSDTQVTERSDGSTWQSYSDAGTGGSGITSLTGDVTATGPGAAAATLAASGVTAATYGDTTHVPQVAVDAKGRVTAASNVAIAFPSDTGITQLTGDVAAGPGSGSQGATIANDAVTYAKMQNVSAADRLLGRGNGGGSGDVQEITLGTNLSLSGTTLNAADTDTGITQLTGDVTAGPGSGSQVSAIGANKVVTAKILDANVTLAKLADLAQATVIGRAAAAGTGVPVALTVTQLTALINAFTSSLSGAAPASGGGTTNYLRADGSWQQPPGTATPEWTTTVTKAVQDDVTNTTTLANDSELVIALTSGKRYLVQGCIYFRTNNAATGYKFLVTLPTIGDNNSCHGYYNTIASGGSSTLTTSAATGTNAWPSSATGLAIGTAAVNVDTVLYFQFLISPTASANMRYQFALSGGAAVGRTVSTMPGSTLRVRQFN